MAYSPENNPYIPGDPYSYDLKWLVSNVKNLNAKTSELDTAIEEASDYADNSAASATASANSAAQAASYATQVGSALLVASQRNILCIGDSYGAMGGGWPNHLTGFHSVINRCVSGTAFYDGTFYNQLAGYTGDRSAITDILVAGGLNDSNFANNRDPNFATLIQKMQQFIAYAKAEYPIARIWLAYIGNAKDNAALLSGRTVYNRTFCKYCYEAYGAKYGYIIIPHVNTLSVSTVLMNTDGIHPNNAGSQEIAGALQTAIQGGGMYSTYPPIKLAVTPAIGTNVNILQSSSGDWASLDITLFNLVGNIGNIPAGGIQAGTLTTIYFNAPVQHRLTFLVNGYTGGSGYCDFLIKFEGNTITLIPTDGTAYTPGTNPAIYLASQNEHIVYRTELTV